MVAHALTYWPNVRAFGPSVPQPPNLTSITKLQYTSARNLRFSPGAYCLRRHEVSGAYCLGACCLRGGLSPGHVVSGGRLSPGQVVSGADCLWGIMSLGHIVSGADCPGAYCLRGTLSQGRIVLGHIVLGRIVSGRIVSGHHVPPPNLSLTSMESNQLARVISEESNLREENRRMSMIIAEATEVRKILLTINFSLRNEV